MSDWSADVCSSDLPERRFAALELDLDAVGVEPVEAGEDRRQRVLAPVESGSVGIDPRYLAIAAAQIAAQCGHENEIIERSGGGETLRHRISVPRAAEDVVVVEHMPFVGERSAERRVGQECVSPCRSGWCPDH